MENLTTHSYQLNVTVIHCDNGPIFKVEFYNESHGSSIVRYTDSTFKVTDDLNNALFYEVFAPRFDK